MQLKEQILRIQEMMGLKENTNTDCQKELETSLPSAVKKWKDWINHPTTKEKFKKNHQLDDLQVNQIFENYNNLLSTLKVVSFNSASNMPDFDFKKNVVEYLSKFGDELFGATWKQVPNTVFVNCNNYSTPYEETIEHEISHLLDVVYPKNPKNKISNLYNNKKLNSKINQKNLDDFLKKANIIDNSETDRITKIYISILDSSKKDKKYYCSDEETLVGIQKLRTQLSKNPNEDITLNEILPYFTFKLKDFPLDIEKLIDCWVIKGTPDINNYLNELNSFAKTTNQTKNSNFV